ncbi:uncharacterized protein LOC144584250 [Pogona vitticeps]
MNFVNDLMNFPTACPPLPSHCPIASLPNPVAFVLCLHHHFERKLGFPPRRRACGLCSCACLSADQGCAVAPHPFAAGMTMEAEAVAIPGKRAVLKKCIGSSICSEGVSIVNIGRRGIITTKVSCCKGDDCRKPALPRMMPFTNSPSNGDPVISSHIAIRGCANQVFCDTFHEGAVHLASLTLIGSGNCELATSTVQGLSVYFLPVLGGLFLLKSIA